MKKQRLLVIDGNYFFHRCLGQLNMGDQINNLETEIEKSNFLNQLKSGFQNIYKTFNNNKFTLIDNVIFVVDNKSWRKEIPAHRPYFIQETSGIPIEYKEQRKEKKKESPINYDNFDILCKEFTEFIKKYIITFDIEGLEGDDNLMLISSKVAQIPNVEVYIFCTDGDLEQTVKNNVSIIRNIKSKDAPFGEFVITLKKYDEIFKPTKAEDVFLGKTIDKNEYNNLFGIKIGDTEGTQKVKRILNEGISIATPFKIALTKSICGDKKDNIFSLMSWKSTTGTRDYKISETHLQKALNDLAFPMTEANCQKILSDGNNILALLNQLKKTCKQVDVDIEKFEIIKHLKHNLNMIILSPNNVPKEYVEAFNKHWDESFNQIMSTLEPTSIMKWNITMKDANTEIFVASLPDELSGLVSNVGIPFEDNPFTKKL